jgi:hypothetical protein
VLTGWRNKARETETFSFAEGSSYRGLKWPVARCSVSGTPVDVLRSAVASLGKSEGAAERPERMAGKVSTRFYQAKEWVYFLF